MKFGEDNFEEVENFVQTNYIDPETPEYRPGGSRTLRFRVEYPVHLAAEGLLRGAKDHPDEEGALDGTATPFRGRKDLCLKFKDEEETEEEELASD